MKPHSFRYYVYNKQGELVFDTAYREDAKVWAEQGGNYIIRKDFLGNYPDKRI